MTSAPVNEKKKKKITPDTAPALVRDLKVLAVFLKLFLKVDIFVCYKGGGWKEVGYFDGSFGSSGFLFSFPALIFCSLVEFNKLFRARSKREKGRE